MLVNDQTEQDELIGWLQGLRGLSESELLVAASPEALAKLQRLVATCIEGGTLPADPTPEEFADIVATLRENERQWSQFLGTALLQAEDAIPAKGREVAAAAMDLFAENCPWLLLREVARAQAASYRSGT